MEYVADTNILLVLILLGIIHVIQAPSAVTFLIFFSLLLLLLLRNGIVIVWWGCCCSRYVNRLWINHSVCAVYCESIIQCVCVCAYTDTGHVCEYIYISGQVCVSVDSLWVGVFERERDRLERERDSWHTSWVESTKMYYWRLFFSFCDGYQTLFCSHSQAHFMRDVSSVL